MGNTRVRQKGYAMRFRQGTCVLLHKLRAEAALGHPLPEGAEVHHPDRDTTNPAARLVICQDASYHALLHVRARVIAAGGDPNTQKICSRCRQLRELTDFSPGAHRCKPCAVLHQADQRRRNGRWKATA